MYIFQGEDSQEDSAGDEDDEENVMFERECSLQELPNEGDGGSSTSLGDVMIKIVYDDDVYGARIVAHKVEDEEEENMVCNHLIAMQTSLDTEGGCTWSALDFSHDPPAYRKFKAIFKNPEDEQVRTYYML